MQRQAKTAVKTKDVVGNRRSVMQQAKLAVRDVYDVATELITNADDAYQRMGSEGVIEFEFERRRGGSVLKFRDYATGMTLEEMDRKLSETGGRDSELEKGATVRGTNSRGAKDVAALGSVLFESITADGLHHSCRISAQFRFSLLGTKKVTKEIRRSMGIAAGRGTLVTLELHPSIKLPQHDTLKKSLESLVSLRDIVAASDRKVVLRDLNKGRTQKLEMHRFETTERLKKTIEIPGYPGVTAKLIVLRAKKPFEKTSPRFRFGGILVKSRHAIHEATLFDPALERDPNALWFCGRLVCPYIDELWNEFDDRFESEAERDPKNPEPIIDPSRKSGLTRSHPFVEALFRGALAQLRPLVEEQRRLAESHRAKVESDATRKRLKALEKAASKFMKELGEDEDAARDDAAKERGSRFLQRGYSLSPPFYQLVVGQAVACRLNIRQESFPEFEVGATVEIKCLTPEIRASKRFASLEPHPNQEGVLQARWRVLGVNPTEATGLKAVIGSISSETTMEVFASEADKYAHVKGLLISKRRYRVRCEKRKSVRVLAPLSMVQAPTELDVTLKGGGFKLAGQRTIRANKKCGVALCDLTVKAGKEEGRGTLRVSLGGQEAEAQLLATAPEGAGIKISIEDKEFGNQRYLWRKNVLEIAARHPRV